MKLFIKPDDVINIEFRIKEEDGKITESNDETDVSVKVIVKRPNYSEHNNIMQAASSVGEDGKAQFNLYAYNAARVNGLIKSVSFSGEETKEDVTGIKINMSISITRDMP